MKFKRISLIAFGPFEDREIDLSSTGLQFILGSNGAGKSTTMRALVGLTYGIADVRDKWRLPDGDSMEIEGTVIGEDGTELTFGRRRREKRVSTLTDPTGGTIDVSALNALLHNVSEESFLSLYRIDAAEMADGGRSFLEEGGEGAALLAATTGIRSISTMTDELNARASEIFTPNGKKQLLSILFREIDALGSEIKKASTDQREWKRLNAELEDRATVASEKQEAVDKAIARVSRLKRIADVAPLVVRLTDLRSEIKTLDQTPLINPDDVSIARTNATQAKLDAENSKQTAARELALVRAELERLTPSLNGNLTALASHVATVNQEIGSAAETLSDLSEQEAKLRQTTRDAIDALRLIQPGHTDLDGIAASLPKVTSIERLNRLIAERGAIDSSIATRQNVIESAKSALMMAQASRPKPAPDEARDLTSLESEYERILRLGDIESDLLDLSAEADESAAKAEALAKALPYSTMTADSLASASIPLRETVIRYQSTFSDLDKHATDCRNAIEAARLAREAATEELAELEANGIQHSPAELASARAKRDSTWDEIRSIWLGGKSPDPEDPASIADELEDQIADADRLGDALGADAKSSARREELQRKLGLTGGKIKELEAEIEGLDAERGEAIIQWSAEWSDAAIAPSSPAEMLEWLEGRREAVAAWESHLSAVTSKAATSTRVEQARAKLSAALTSVGLDAIADNESLTTCLERCRRAIEADRKDSAERESAEQALSVHTQALAEAESKLAEERSRLDAWKQEWIPALNAVGIDSDLQVHEVKTAVEAFSRLGDAIGKIEGINRRVSGMRARLEEFSDRITKLCASGEFSPPQPVEDDPVSAAKSLTAAIADATEAQGQHSTATSQAEKLAQTIRTAEDAIADANTTIDSLMKEAACSTIDDLKIVEAEARRKAGLQLQIDELERSIVDRGSEPLAELEAAVNEVEVDALAAAVAREEQQLELLKEALAEAQQERGAAQQRRSSVDDTARVAELAADREAKIAEAAELVTEFTRVRALQIAVDRAVRRIIEENQHPIVASASKLFASLTSDGFDGLEIDNETLLDQTGHGPLVAVRGSSRTPAGALSDGERDVLYLALRIAGIERHIEDGTVMPVIIDDALISLDDDRASRSLAALGELSKKTQVIVFTHHPHLVDLARAALPEGGYSVTNL